MVTVGAEYAQAAIEQDWLTLGYSSVEALRADELGELRFSVESRQQITEATSLGGDVPGGNG
jgi:hypothetical protein